MFVFVCVCLYVYAGVFECPNVFLLVFVFN